MCILQAQRIAPKIYFFKIPDTRNTRWFWKKIGYGSGTAKNYRVGSGIGYPSVTGGNHESNRVTPSNGSWAEIRPPGAPKRAFWAKSGPFGPPWVPKRPQGGTIKLISMYFTCEKCFRVPWTLSGHLLARSSISPSGGVSWTNNLNFAVVKSFWWSTKAKSLSKCKMVLEVYFR